MSYEGRPNVVGILEGSGGGRSMIMQSHTDVVPGADWTDAFDPKFDGEYVSGRGAMDAKGQVIMQRSPWPPCIDLGVELGRRRRAAGGHRGGAGRQRRAVAHPPGLQRRRRRRRRGLVAQRLPRQPRRHLVPRQDPGSRCTWAGARGRQRHREDDGSHPPDAHLRKEDRRRERRTIRSSSATRPRCSSASASSAPGAGPPWSPAECMLEGGVGFLPNKSMEQVKANCSRRSCGPTTSGSRSTSS